MIDPAPNNKPTPTINVKLALQKLMADTNTENQSCLETLVTHDAKLMIASEAILVRYPSTSQVLTLQSTTNLWHSFVEPIRAILYRTPNNQTKGNAGIKQNIETTLIEILNQLYSSTKFRGRLEISNRPRELCDVIASQREWLSVPRMLRAKIYNEPILYLLIKYKKISLKELISYYKLNYKLLQIILTSDHDLTMHSLRMIAEEYIKFEVASKIHETYGDIGFRILLCNAEVLRIFEHISQKDPETYNKERNLLLNFFKEDPILFRDTMRAEAVSFVCDFDVPMRKLIPFLQEREWQNYTNFLDCLLYLLGDTEDEQQKIREYCAKYPEYVEIICNTKFLLNAKMKGMITLTDLSILYITAAEALKICGKPALGYLKDVYKLDTMKDIARILSKISWKILQMAQEYRYIDIHNALDAPPIKAGFVKNNDTEDLDTSPTEEEPSEERIIKELSALAEHRELSYGYFDSNEGAQPDTIKASGEQAGEKASEEQESEEQAGIQVSEEQESEEQTGIQVSEEQESDGNASSKIEEVTADLVEFIWLSDEHTWGSERL